MLSSTFIPGHQTAQNYKNRPKRDHTLDADTTVNLHTLSFTMPDQSLPCDQAKYPTSIIQAVQTPWVAIPCSSQIVNTRAMKETSGLGWVVRWWTLQEVVSGSRLWWHHVGTLLCVLTNVWHLHVFANASMKAHEAVAYLQSADQVDLVMAKSWVSPLKGTTLPRLELWAAVVAAHLAKFIASTMQSQLSEVNIRLWSDSQIALHWIFSSKQLKPFVAIRVRKFAPCFLHLCGITVI